MPIASFKCVREVSSEDAVHVAENLLKESAGKKWRTKSGNEKSAYVILEFQEPQQITGIDIGNEHSAFIEVLVSRTGCQADDFRELLLSSSFMTPIESKNSSNQNRVRCFSSPSLDQTALPEKWKLLKIVCTQPFNRHVQYGISFVKVHVVAAPTPTAAPAKVKSLLPERMMQFGAFKLREESPDSENDSQLTRFQSWKKESHLKQQSQSAPATTAAAIRDAGSTALKRLSLGKVSASLPKPLSSPSPVPIKDGEASDVKPLDRNRASLLFGEDDDDASNVEDADEQSAKKRRLSKHLEADKDRRRQEQEQQQKEKECKKDKSKSRHSLDKSKSKDNKSSGKEEEKPDRKDMEKGKEKEKKESKPGAKREDKHESRSKHRENSKTRDNSRPSAQKRLSSSPTNTPAKKPRIKDKDTDPIIHYRPFNQLLSGVVLVISGIQNPDRADLRSKATALGAKYKADWEPGCTHLICAFKNTPKYNQVKGKGKIVTRSWIEKCYNLRKYLPWRRYALDTNDLGQPESDEELCDEARKPSSRRESNEEEDDETIEVTNTYDADPKDKKKLIQSQEEASSGIDTEDELQRVADENRKKKAKHKTLIKAKSEEDIYDVSTEEEDFLVEKKKQIIVVD
ncbi:hypothetical protein KR059_010140 [Drosophila kikkawai]|nr:hypothetical protein KR059_010140 [Drosophila kikkawai]